MNCRVDDPSLSRVNAKEIAREHKATNARSTKPRVREEGMIAPHPGGPPMWLLIFDHIHLFDNPLQCFNYILFWDILKKVSTCGRFAVLVLVAMAKVKLSPFDRRLCRVLVAARRNAALQQTEVAKRLSRPQSYVSKVESGERRLDVGEFVELAAAIGTDPVTLLRKAVQTSK